MAAAFAAGKAPRLKGEDFSAALPLLDEARRMWPRKPLIAAYGEENRWLERL